MNMINNIDILIAAKNAQAAAEGYAEGKDESKREIERLKAEVENWRRQALEEDARANEACSSQSVERGFNNGAKLREALKRCVKMLDICLLYSRDGYPSQSDDIIEAMEKAEAALSTPPRNCDRFGGNEEAQVAFLKEEWLIDVDDLSNDPYNEWSGLMKGGYGRWLLAPEKKGHTNGNK